MSTNRKQDSKSAEISQIYSYLFQFDLTSVLRFIEETFSYLIQFLFFAMKSEFCIPSVLINTVLLLVSKDPTDSSPCEYIHQNFTLQEEHSLLTGSQVV